MPAPRAASTGTGLITCATRQLWSLNPSRRAYMKFSVNNQSKCPESRTLNGRIGAFVSSVGANSTPDIGESIFSGHFRRCQCWCWQHPRWCYGHTEVFALTHQICGRAKHFCRRHRVPQDTHKHYVGNLDARICRTARKTWVQRVSFPLDTLATGWASKEDWMIDRTIFARTRQNSLLSHLWSDTLHRARKVQKKKCR